jgi:hypothetical protein
MNQLTKRAQLIDVNGYAMTTDGRFHANLLADLTIKKHLDTHVRNKWMTLREAAQHMYRSGSLTRQDDIRKRLGKLADELKARGFCLVVEPDTRAFKLYEGTEVEKQHVQNKQGYWEARARRAGEWSDYLDASVAATPPDDSTK